MFRNLAILLVTLTSLTGCVSSFKIDSTPEKLANVKTVAVVRVLEPKPYGFVFCRVNPAALGLGALPALALEAVVVNQQVTAREQLDQIITKNSSVPISDILTEAVVAKLRANGFDSSIVDAQWEHQEAAWNKNEMYKLPLQNIKSDADAILAISYNLFGFVNEQKAEASGFDPARLVNTPTNSARIDNFQPVIWTMVNLLGKNRTEILYRGFHAAGWKLADDPRVIPYMVPRHKDWKHTPVPVSFTKIDEFAADPQRIIAAFHQAAEAIAASIAEDLKR
jgi:hypothetical protein